MVPRILAAAAVIALVAFASAPGLAAAQSTAPAAPTAAEKAITLSTPGVVFVATSVAVRVRLTLQNAARASGLSHVDQTYKLEPYAFGSGFVVNPSGVVVTASHVVEPDQQALHNYAANNLILEGLHYNYPRADSSEFSQYNLPLHFFNNLLHQCYKGIDCDFAITPSVTVFKAVATPGSQKAQGAPARVLNSTGFANTDVAVLQMNGSNMPTVPLAPTAQNLSAGDEIVALGFPATSVENFQSGVTTPAKVFGHVSTIRTEGTSQVIEIDANVEHGESGGPVVNDSAQVIGLVSFGFGGSTGPNYLRTADDIRTALSAAGVKAQRGAVDAAFDAGLRYFWGHHYSAAVPQLNKALQLSPGFPLAQQYLSQAQVKKGTASDVPLSGGGGIPVVVWIVALAGLAVAVVAVVFVARRKSEPAAGVAAGAPGPAIGTMSGFPPVAPAAPAAPPSGAMPPLEPMPPEPPREPAPPVRPAPVAEQPPPPTPEGEAGTESAAEPDREGVHFCSNCGHRVQADERFCPNCGNDLRV